MQQASYIYKNFSKLKTLSEILEDLYLHEFYKDNKKAGEEELKNIIQGNLITHQQSFHFGLFFGVLGCMTLIVILVSI